MSTPTRSIISPRQLLSTLHRHFLLWGVPTVLLTALAVVYGVIRPVSWRASQAIIVRDEAGGSATARQGRFDTIEAMKAAQETVVQMAHNPSTIKAALVEAGPLDGGEAPASWPGKAEIEVLQAAITVSPPKGGEFGRNEVIYLAVEGPTRERAVQLTKAVGNQLEVQLQAIRKTKAQSLIGELEKSVSLAETDLVSATARLKETEKSVGRDLDELRALTESNGGTSNLRATSNQLQEEIRRTQIQHEVNSEQLKLLAAAREDHNRLLAAPQRLFEQQPGLKRLKDGLVDSQLRTAQLLGRMSADHPEVQAAKLAEDKIRQQLSDEIGLVISNLENDLKVTAALLTTLGQQQTEINERLNHVAGLRPAYANQLAAVRQRTENLSEVMKDLADVRASQAAALSSSLIARIDEPQPDNNPVGPGFPTIVAAGFGGGLIFGLGLVFLTAPLGSIWGRRASDYVGRGRRASDQPPLVTPEASSPPSGRRASDVPRVATRQTERMPTLSELAAAQQAAKAQARAAQGG
jgi:uncharacterized protein involved in exopolysaccharide biosynthesis